MAEQDRELLAPDPCDQIAFAELRPGDGGDVLQHGVARQMAVGVVDPLEMVDVEQGERDRLIALQTVFDLLEESPAIGQAGQFVGARGHFAAFGGQQGAVGAITQLGVEQLARGDVANDAADRYPLAHVDQCVEHRDLDVAHNAAMVDNRCREVEIGDVTVAQHPDQA
ncbi:hypothetical protein ASE00_03725 [Sphingomonas sp. Root710]|nr:hypothetical protein ASE00_03725 [Sphingomonas sp. Root710]